MQVIKDAVIIAGNEMEVIDKGYIIVENGRIADLGPGSPELPTRSAEINADGMIIGPCFINMHTHIGDSVAKEVGAGLSVEELFFPPDGLKHKILRTTRDDQLIASMRDAMLDMLSCGVSTFADFRENGIKGVKLLLDAAKGLPIRPFICGRLDKFPFTKDEILSNEKKLPDESVEEIENILKFADAISTSSTLDLTDPALEQMFTISTKLNKKRAIHVAELSSIKHPITGMSEVERVVKYFTPHFVVHMTNATDKDIDIIAERRIPVVCCPRANTRLGEGFPPIRKMIEKRITLALGTDNVMLNSPDLFREMEYVSKTIKGLEREVAFLHPKEILKMATINGARALALDKDIGSIERGKIANLVFIDSNDINLRPVREPVASIVHRVRPDNVKAVMIEGKLLKREHFIRQHQRGANQEFC